MRNGYVFVTLMSCLYGSIVIAEEDSTPIKTKCDLEIIKKSSNIISRRMGGKVKVKHTLKREDIVLKNCDKMSKKMVCNDICGKTFIKDQSQTTSVPHISKETHDCTSVEDCRLNPKISFGFTIGQESSTFNTTETTSDSAFHDSKSFVEISGLQRVSDDFATWFDRSGKCQVNLTESLKFGSSNIEQKDESNELVVIREAEVIIANASFWVDVNNCGNKRNVQYIKLSSGFVFNEDSRVTNDTRGNTFLLYGMRDAHNLSDSKGSYIEVGFGHDERFRQHERGLIISGESHYKLEGSEWRFIANAELNAGPGADDFRISFGVKRDFVFFAELFSKTIGFKREKTSNPATDTNIGQDK